MDDNLGIIGSLGDDARRTPLSGSDVQSVVDQVAEVFARLDADGLDARQLVTALGGLEHATSSAAALKAKLTAALVGERTRSDRDFGVPSAQCGKAAAHEVALARIESPAKGREHVRVAAALTTDLPETMRALERGDINERRAEIIVSESQDLSREDRRRLDAEIGGWLAGKGDKEIRHEVRRLVSTIDADGAERRARRARSRRRVTVRDLGNGMARVCGDLPAEEAASAMTSLGEYADAWKQMGDQRTRDQLRADAFAERLVGSPFGVDSADEKRKKRSVEVQLVMSAEMLLGGDDTTPAHLPGFGPLPLGIAREIIANADGELFVRRIYADPTHQGLVAMDSKGIKFPVGLRTFINARDAATCRTPYCNAPVRHADHVRGRARGGATSDINGEGLCEACNYAKEAPQWRHRPRDTWPERHTVTITTPTGHTYDAVSPPLPMPPTRSGIKGELYRCDLALAY